MSDGNSIIHPGDLSKPATGLIKKVSEVFGGVFLPYQIKRIAEAEKIKAWAGIVTSEMRAS